jgi:hypothetical protein
VDADRAARLDQAAHRRADVVDPLPQRRRDERARAAGPVRRRRRHARHARRPDGSSSATPAAVGAPFAHPTARVARHAASPLPASRPHRRSQRPAGSRLAASSRLALSCARLAISLALTARGLGFGAPASQRSGGIVSRSGFGQLRIARRSHLARVANDHESDRDQQCDGGDQGDHDRFFRVGRGFCRAARFSFLRCRGFRRGALAQFIEGTSFGVAAHGQCRRGTRRDQRQREQRARAQAGEACAPEHLTAARHQPSIPARLARDNDRRGAGTIARAVGSQTIE